MWMNSDDFQSSSEKEIRENESGLSVSPNSTHKWRTDTKQENHEIQKLAAAYEKTM